MTPLNRLLTPLKRRLQLLVDRAVLRIVTDSSERQQLQIQTQIGDTNSDVDRWQNYGHTSVPPLGAEAITLSVGGSRSNLVVICAEDKSVRLKDLDVGDSALYHLEGHFFKLTKDKRGQLVADEITIKVKRANISATEEVVINTPSTRFEGDVHITGKTTGDGEGIFDKINTSKHKHKETGNITDDPVKE